MKRDTQEVMALVREALNWAELGLADVMGDNPPRHFAGLANVAVWGRSVTSRLQTLRSSEGQAFDDWYKPHQAVMRQDPLLRYFYKLRTEILKVGTPLVTRTIVEHFGQAEMDALKASAPKGAIGFFFGDQYGGDAWEIQLPDGTIEKYYVTLPDSYPIQTYVMFAGPMQHLGEVVDDGSMQNFASLYIAYLTALVEDAERTFSSP